MANYTENYNLVMPSDEDFYDVSCFNENFETIDTILLQTEENLSSFGEKMDNCKVEIQEDIDTSTNEIKEAIGSATDANNSSLFGKLNQINSAVSGISLIKSIQRVTYTVEGESSGSVSIKTVNPQKCIVIMERLEDENTSLSYFSYTLNASSISCTHNRTHNMLCGFWIIEFN